jgi:hypothetical protein
MYSLFDTLMSIQYTKSIDENNIDDDEYAYIKNILMEHDTDVMTLTTIFDFDIQRSTSTNNCLILACYLNTGLPIIKYLIEECKMDINHKNQYNNNCLTRACLNNTNLAVIKYLIEECKMDINHENQDNNNCLALACLNNTNLAVIKYLIEECKMDINHITHRKNNYLGLACIRNTNLAIITYLMEEHKIDTNHVNYDNDNCLGLACWKNINLGIVKYLIEDHKMDINHVDRYNNNCLMAACMNNTNLAVIKYLIEECKMDINHLNQNIDDCLALACYHNSNLQVIKYLIKEHQMNIEKLTLVQYNKFKDIVLTISKEYRNLNNLLLTGYEKYTNNEMKNLIELINPLQLNNDIKNLAGIQNPYDYKFTKFAILVDELSYESDLIEKQIKVDKKKNMNMNNRKKKKKNTNKQELLFVHNKTEYYGDRNKVYGSIQVLNDLWDQYDMTESIVLEGSLPCYAINQYIEACSGTPFKLKNIHEDDFISFLKFIDQYPAVQISIPGIEDQIIQYVTRYNTRQEAYFKTIYARYDLKKLYLHMHNLKLALKVEH